MKNKPIFGLAAAAMLLSMVIVGGLEAQELKLDGYFNSGIGVVHSGIEDDDLHVKVFGVDSEQNGYRFRLNGSYQNEAGNSGVRFRLQSQNTLSNGYLSLPQIYGWARFAADIFYTAAGIVDDGTWVTGDWWLSFDRIDTGLGALLKATPVKGLDLGLGVYVLNLRGGGDNNVLGSGSNGFSSVSPTISDAKYTINGAYTLADTFRLSATYRLKNKAGYDTASAGDGYNGNAESSRFIGEFRFLGLKDLTAIVAASFDKIEDFADAGNTILSETFAYKIDSLGIGLNAAQFLYSRGDTDYDPGLLFNLWGSYTINNIVPRLDLVYFSGGRSQLGGGNGTYHRRGFANVASVQDVDNDYSVFSVRPSVKFNLSNRTTIEIGDKINYDFANFDGFRKDGKTVSADNPGDTDSRLSNVFYVDFRWTF